MKTKEYKTNLCEYKLICKEVNTPYKRIKITDPRDVADYVRPFISETLMAFETFMIIGLNKANNTVGWGIVSQGGLSNVLVDMRILMKMALDMCCNGIILCHNHPSGTLQPSAEDRALTKRVVSACELVDLRLLDHVIITKEDYYSFANHGEL
jgi:DNA repair protein RadC